MPLYLFVVSFKQFDVEVGLFYCVQRKWYSLKPKSYTSSEKKEIVYDLNKTIFKDGYLVNTLCHFKIFN